MKKQKEGSIIFKCLSLVIMVLILVLAACKPDSKPNSAITTYTVSFNANGGSGTVHSPLTVEEGESITLPGGRGLSKSGYAFSSWNTMPDGTGTNYSAGSSYTPIDDIILYVKWATAETVSSREVTIDMYDSAGDGWDGNGALRITVNGTQVATGVKVSSGNTNTYKFTVNAGDVVQFYWIAGSAQEENSFIAYYTDTPPSPLFTANNNSSWNGENALVYKLRGTMNSISGDTLLGSFTVAGDILPYTVTFNANNGSGTAPSSQTVIAGESINLPNGSELTNNGYAFSGWNTEADGTGTDYNAGTSYTPIDDITLYAKWVAAVPVSSREITIDMYDYYGDGWDGNGALRITVNGTQVATGIKVSSGFTNTYKFTVNTGDAVQFYWVAGSAQDENSFIAYYTDTPPSPAFTNSSWNGENALVYKLRGTMSNITNDTSLGSFTVAGGTRSYTVSFNNNGGNGTTHADQTVNDGSSITLPSGNDLIKTGYTFSGWNTEADGTGTNYNAGSSFTPTDNITLYAKWDIVVSADRIEYYWVDQHGSLVTTSGGITSIAPGATLTITAQGTGYVVKEWHLNGVNTGQSGNIYNFSSTSTGKHTVGLFVEKDGSLYNTNITITVGTLNRTVTINMYDSYGDGWNGCALRINVNGVQIATNVTIQSGSTNTYTFSVATGNIVQLYWSSGSYQDEVSFIVYYADTPPSPAFTASNNASWSGSNALVYRLRGAMNNISGGTLLGSFTVQ